MTTDISVEAIISLPVDALDLWSSVFGSAFESAGDHFQSVEFLNGGDWDTLCEVEIVAEHPTDSDKTITTTICFQDIVKAVGIALKNGYTHCGQPITIKYTDNDFDACVGDIILQCAVYGEAIFG